MPFEITNEADLATLINPFEKSRPNSGSLITQRVSDIQAKPISWLWPKRIARGKLTMIAGNPGLGKSQITASIAAVVTTGGVWPVDGARCEIGEVLFLTAEDDAADTLRPRLEAAGADLKRVHVIKGVAHGRDLLNNRAFSLRADLDALGKELATLGSVAAVFIDPITAYLGDVDSHKNADVRSILAPASELAGDHKVAIIGVSHLNKATAMEALMRVSGSLAFVAASRAAWLVAADPDEKTRRLFVPMKNNLAPDTSGLAYRIKGATVESPEGAIETSLVVWESESVTRTADEIMQTGSPQKSSALADATEWLSDILAEGPVAAQEVFERAKAEGHKEATIRRAKKSLGIKPVKSDFGGGWEWPFPPKVIKNTEDAQSK